MFDATRRDRRSNDNHQSNGILKNCSRYSIGIGYKGKKVRIMHLLRAK
jgi:hypothetical protein